MDDARHAQLREHMVETQLIPRGIRDPRVLEALRVVPRHLFLPPELVEHAYDDNALPIGSGQTISQPFIVALMAQALELRAGDVVLDVGTGSGYAAAVLAQLARHVYSIERHAALAQRAAELLQSLGYANVTVRTGNGWHGWQEHAPYDAISVAAGGDAVPAALQEQLALGGRLVIPIGPHGSQQLLRLTRESNTAYVQHYLGEVAFVPLVNADGDTPLEADAAGEVPLRRYELTSFGDSADSTVFPELERSVEQFAGLDALPLDGLLERIGNARVVCIGEATHGTSEFYRVRERVTRALIERARFTIVAAEADWPDARHIHNYVHGSELSWWDIAAFVRFPTWMWRNEEVYEFAEWLRRYNATAAPERRAGFFGLDLYSLYGSIDAVLQYLDARDPETAQLARARYGCLLPWRDEPQLYGRLAVSQRYRDCEGEVTAMLGDLLRGQTGSTDADYMDAVFNAQIVASAEAYYRTMYYGAVESWNLRDQHMFDTLQRLLESHGPDSRAVVWAHNSHVGDARATEMGRMGEHNVGQLCREAYGDAAYLIGFGTHSGSVMAASEWDGAGEVKQVRLALESSWEDLFHRSGLPRFTLPLREARGELQAALHNERLERAIGVIYLPASERFSHYFHATLGRQFDEYIWLDETSAVTPLPAQIAEEIPETFPFGL
jgi:protein-L-isoaspartate(D-aspartate) O-methyltransferase